MCLKCLAMKKQITLFFLLQTCIQLVVVTIIQKCTHYRISFHFNFSKMLPKILIIITTTMNWQATRVKQTKILIYVLQIITICTIDKFTIFSKYLRNKCLWEVKKTLAINFNNSRIKRVAGLLIMILHLIFF